MFSVTYFDQISKKISSNAFHFNNKYALKRNFKRKLKIYATTGIFLAFECRPLVMGDGDGVLVVPRADVASLIDLADARVRAEAQGMREIAVGTWQRGWIDEALARV